MLNHNQSGVDYSYLYDGKGNVMAVLDPSQSVVASYRYSPFGKLLSKSGTLDQPYTFSTKRYDEKTGLNYYGFRYYDPAIGRWLTRDPLGEAGGMNLYGFVENSPVNFVDPRGENPLLYIAIAKGLAFFTAYVGVDLVEQFINSFVDDPCDKYKDIYDDVDWFLMEAFAYQEAFLATGFVASKVPMLYRFIGLEMLKNPHLSDPGNLQNMVDAIDAATSGTSPAPTYGGAGGYIMKRTYYFIESIIP